MSTSPWHQPRRVRGRDMTERIPAAASRPDPHAQAAISGEPPEPTRETDLLRAGKSLDRIVRDMGDTAHRYALQDLVDYLTGHLGAPGSAWPVRLPVPETAADHRDIPPARLTEEPKP